MIKKFFIVASLLFLVSLLIAPISIVPSGGGGGGSGITEGQASTIASNAATALNLWTNENGTIRLVKTNGPVVIGTNATTAGAGFYVKQSVINPNIVNFFENHVSGNTDTPYIFVVNAQNDGYTGQGSVCAIFGDELPANGGTDALYSNGGTFGLWAENTFQAGVLTNGEAIANYGFQISDHLRTYAVAGFAQSPQRGTTNIGVAGSSLMSASQSSSTSNAPVGGYFETTYESANAPMEPAVLLADNRTTGRPIFIARTNAGSFKALEVQGTKTTNATPLDVAGLTTLYGGIYAQSNSAPLTTVAPANLHSVTLGKGWTNDLGARADLVLSVKYVDSATGDPALAFTNSITGEAWTNSVAFGLAATVKDTIVIPDLSPNDRGSFTDLSGAGATVTILNAWWKLK